LLSIVTFHQFSIFICSHNTFLYHEVFQRTLQRSNSFFSVRFSVFSDPDVHLLVDCLPLCLLVTVVACTQSIDESVALPIYSFTILRNVIIVQRCTNSRHRVIRIAL
jgi:hypothetical protein